MSIQVKFFASLRETLGLSEIAIPPVPSVEDAWNIATQKAEPPKNMLVAVNLDYATFDSALNDGDEVAFFPPVTGG